MDGLAKQHLTRMSQHCTCGWEDRTITRSILNDVRRIDKVTKGYVRPFLSLYRFHGEVSRMYSAFYNYIIKAWNLKIFNPCAGIRYKIWNLIRKKYRKIEQLNSWKTREDVLLSYCYNLILFYLVFNFYIAKKNTVCKYADFIVLRQR